MNAVIISVQIEPVSCCNCGTVFGINDGQLRSLRRSGDWFYCPNGHQQRFTETDADRLRKKLELTEQARERARIWAQSVQDQYDAERKSHAATKGQLTKTRKRIAAGVCPCCRRTFANLGRHMTGKHPDYAQETP